ncbi:MAG: ATP-binding protein [Spirochaetales bacterium]|nr:ATP-binding protein [Spirochaetales bacterium]
MRRKLLKELILEGQETFELKKPIPRDISFDPQLSTRLNKVITVSGVRRAGKSMYLKQISLQLETDPQQVVFLDFSESPLTDFSLDDFSELPTLFKEMFPQSEPVFFFDEIQEVPDFEKGLRYLQNRNYPIIITGSSAQLFSRDIASRLRGKTAEIKVYPLSYFEFLRFKEFEIKPVYGPAEKARLALLTDEYLTWGGFPEVVLTDNPETKRHLLKGYIDTMLLRDVIEKNGVQNMPLMDKLLSKVIDSFTKNISINKWYNDFKSSGFKVSKDTLYAYLGYLKDTGFIHTLHEYGKSQGSAQKVYLIDNGLYEVRRKLNRDRGKLLENAVFAQLLREEHSISYWNNSSYEIDFITESKLVQACYSLNRDNSSREILPFEEFNSLHQTKLKGDLVVIESELPIKEATLFYDWLLP